jgi:hypothetical protein
MVSKVSMFSVAAQAAMPEASGHVTVVPVEKGRAEWSSRDQSPCTARLRSKGSRRDASPYGGVIRPAGGLGRSGSGAGRARARPDPVPSATAGRALVRQNSLNRTKKEVGGATVKREVSITRREGGQRLGARAASPNRSSSSLRPVGRTQSSGRAASRSSSFTRAEVRAAPVVRSGLATLPRDSGGGRSRSSGEYVTVLEIGAEGGARSRSAGAPRGGARGAPPAATDEKPKRAGVSRSSSLRRAGGRVGEGPGPVTVLVKQPAGPATGEGKPARKQSIKIGGEGGGPEGSSESGAALTVISAAQLLPPAVTHLQFEPSNLGK